MTTAETATDKLDFKRILPIIAIVLVDLMGLSIIIPLMPLFAARFGANPLIIGILQAAYPSMQFIGTPILGRLSDRFGRKPILLFSQLGTLAGFILLGFANALWILFLSRIIDGLSGANLSTAQAAVADSTDEKIAHKDWDLSARRLVLDSFWDRSSLMWCWPLRAGTIERSRSLRLSSR